MLSGHNWSSVEVSHVALKRRQQPCMRRRSSRRMRRIALIVVFLLCLSLCSLGLSYIVQYVRSQFPAPPATPTHIVIVAHAPTPTVVTPAAVSSRTDHYIGLILRNNSGAHHLAYSMLSSEQMQQESFTKFERDMNYTLLPGCWRVVQMSPSVLKQDRVTWETGAVLEYVPYGGGAVETFFWHFQWRTEQGQLVVVAIGLYPTGVDSSVSFPC